MGIMAILKKILRIILKSLTIIVILFIGLITLLDFFGDDSSDMCGSKFIEQSNSPNGNLKAVIFQYDCGATTSFTTHVGIMDSSESIYETHKIKSIFSADTNHERAPSHAIDGGPEVQVAWLSNRELEIQHHTLARVHVAESFLLFKWLKIKYSTFE